MLEVLWAHLMLSMMASLARFTPADAHSSAAALAACCTASGAGCHEGGPCPGEGLATDDAHGAASQTVSGKELCRQVSRVRTAERERADLGREEPHRER